MLQTPSAMSAETNSPSPTGGVARNLAYLLGARSFYLVSKTAYTIVIARLLGPALYGILNYAISWSVAFLPAASLGLWAVMSREAGLDRARGIKTAGHAFTLRIFSSIAAAIASAILAAAVETDTSVRTTLLIISFALIGRAQAQYCENVFNAFENSATVLRQESVFRTLELLLGAAAALAGRSVECVAAAYAVVWWLQAAWGFWRVRVDLPTLHPGWDGAELRRLLRQGIPLGVSSGLILLLGTAPVLLFRHVGTREELGQLAILSQVFSIASLVPTQLAIAALPTLARAMAGRGAGAWDSVSSGLRASLAVVLLGATATCAVGPLLVKGLVGAAYDEGGRALGPFLFVLLPRSWGTLLWNALLAQGRLWAGTASALLGTLVLCGTLLATQGQPTLDSVIVSMNAGQWTWVAALLIALHPPRASFSYRRTLWVPLLFLTLAWGVMKILSFLGPMLAGTAAFLFVVWGTRWGPLLFKAERQIFWSYIQRHTRSLRTR